jgi:hypothetical protein
LEILQQRQPVGSFQAIVVTDWDTLAMLVVLWQFRQQAEHPDQ